MTYPLPDIIQNSINKCYSNNDLVCSTLPPSPRKGFPNFHIAAHSDVIYDSEDHWLSSKMLLSLGTICISYKTDSDLSVQTFGIKVAQRDLSGNPQIWSQLPFLEPDISRIYDKLIAKLSGEFVTTTTFETIINGLSSDISDISNGILELSTTTKNLSSKFDTLSNSLSVTISSVISGVISVQISTVISNEVLTATTKAVSNISGDIVKNTTISVVNTITEIYCGSGNELTSPGEVSSYELTSPGEKQEVEYEDK